MPARKKGIQRGTNCDCSRSRSGSRGRNGDSSSKREEVGRPPRGRRRTYNRKRRAEETPPESGPESDLELAREDFEEEMDHRSDQEQTGAIGSQESDLQDAVVAEFEEDDQLVHMEASGQETEFVSDEDEPHLSDGQTEPEVQLHRNVHSINNNATVTSGGSNRR